MARSTKPPSAFRVKLAVHMRRCGSTWRAVGLEVGCSPETVRQWPRIYPEEWQAAVRDDAVQTAAKSGGEAVGALRMMLNDGSERTRVKAAGKLIDLRLGLGRNEIRAKRAEKSHSGWWDSVFAILKERSHVELKFVVELCLQLADEKRNLSQPVRPSAM